MKGLVKGYGYPVASGYMGYVNGQYMLFATEEEYYDYCKDQEEVQDERLQ